MKTGWKSNTLGNTCDMYQPKTISGKEMVDDGAYPVFGANGIIGRYDKYNHEETQLLITCRGATCGSVNISSPKSWITGNAMVVRPKTKEIDLTFLEYLFRGGIDISKAITGTAQPQITQTNLSKIQIFYPESISEQRRIVAILDQAFAGIATAKANAEQNLKNARALFESHLQSVFTERGEGWVEKPLNSIAEFSQGIQVALGDQRKKPGEGLVRFIRIVDYTQGTDNVRYVKNHGKKYWADKADIVMVRYGTPGLIGRGIEGLIANNLFKISILNKQLINDFLVYFLSQRSIQGYLRNQGALAMPAITFKQLGGVVVTYPTEIEKQKSIVLLLDSIDDETQRLKNIYQQKLVALDDLKKSLLNQAFSGNL
ncbi:hypothetical protein CKO12_13405 [Chromatium okenii]|uniref:restriction endonuclease subunit S n=1 Tax=Chromatium okenii TaxID=61644 RepID=UPI001A933F69|nr:restriction endonuclease subunit S [Chromatium okenii]MBK1642847.1 hypothetical protein [Chromatium okenii]